MSKKRTAALAAAGLAVGLLAAPVQSALAGHLNEVVEADLDGRQEVATGATKSRIVGDPNGDVCCGHVSGGIRACNRNVVRAVVSLYRAIAQRLT